MTETPTATQWYIARDGAQHGPLSDAEIRMFVQSGHMRPTDLVWRPGFAEWQPAQSVFPPPAPTPPAAPSEQAPQSPSAHQAPGPRPHHSEPSQPRPEQRSPQAPSSPAAARPAAGNPASNPPGHAGAGGHPGHRPTTTGAPNRASQDPYSARQAGPHPASTHVAPTENEEEYLEDEAPPPRRRSRGAIALVAILVLIGAGGWLAATNQDTILAMANMTTNGDNGPPVVKAEGETKTAALDNSQSAANSPAPQPTPATPPSQSTQKPTVTPQMIDENFQRSQLWQQLKADFPEWYQTNIEEAARIVSAGTEADMSKHLIVQLVELRRKNAEHALAADTSKLINVAQSFLANLKSLASHSAATCYSFIGQGESSPAVIELFPQRGYGEAIEAQIAAIFEAVSDGRKSPVSRVRATKSDYDVLAAELTKLGWSKADLRVFADPKALAQTEHEKVCKMVQDWFSAHLAISNAAVQERLLFETLRPIVAG